MVICIDLRGLSCRILDKTLVDALTQSTKTRSNMLTLLPILFLELTLIFGRSKRPAIRRPRD